MEKEQQRWDNKSIADYILLLSALFESLFFSSRCVLTAPVSASLSADPSTALAHIRGGAHWTATVPKLAPRAQPSQDFLSGMKEAARHLFFTLPADRRVHYNDEVAGREKNKLILFQGFYRFAALKHLKLAASLVFAHLKRQHKFLPVE